LQLLGHQVNGHGLSTSAHRVESIRQLPFPKTLHQLENYIGMTGWLRQFVPFYASLAEPLQNRKTQLLSAGHEQGKVQPNATKKRKIYTTRTSWEHTAAELQSFQAIQAYLRDPKYLSHFYPEKLLFIFHTNEASVSCYSILKTTPKFQPISQIASTQLQPIMFLSKLLSPAERNYHATELEIACLVYACRKLRVMIQSSLQPVAVITDHASTKGVVRQQY
jgi:hypothetical protein